MGSITGSFGQEEGYNLHLRNVSSVAGQLLFGPRGIMIKQVSEGGPPCPNCLHWSALEVRWGPRSRNGVRWGEG